VMTYQKTPTLIVV